MPRNMLSKSELYLYDTQGVLHVPGVLSAEEVEHCRSVFKDTKPHRWFDFAKADRWDDIRAIDAKINSLSNDPRIIDRVFPVINQPMRLIESYGLSYHPGGHLFMHNGNTQDLTYTDGCHATKNMAYRTEYHDGKLYSTYVKALIYLVDIESDDDGPFCFVHGSHKANYPFPWPKDSAGNPVLLAESEFPGLAKVHLRAGDMVILNDGLLHGAMRTTVPDKNRLMMTFSYAPSFMADWNRIDPVAGDIETVGYYDLADESDFFE